MTPAELRSIECQLDRCCALSLPDGRALLLALKRSLYLEKQLRSKVPRSVLNTLRDCYEAAAASGFDEDGDTPIKEAPAALTKAWLVAQGAYRNQR